MCFVSKTSTIPEKPRAEFDVAVGISDYRLQEYQALRAEKLYRYDYANRMVNLLLTATISIWTLDFALFGVNFADYVPNRNVSAGVRCSLELAQAIIFLLPAWLSVTFFHNSLRNNIRINLISDYLRTQAKLLFREKPYVKTWEDFKRKTDLFYFSPIGNSEKSAVPARVGELQDLHGFISWVSVAICAIMIVSIAFNCLPSCCLKELSSESEDSSENIDEATSTVSSLTGKSEVSHGDSGEGAGAGQGTVSGELIIDTSGTDAGSQIAAEDESSIIEKNRDEGDTENNEQSKVFKPWVFAGWYLVLLVVARIFKRLQFKKTGPSKSGICQWEQRPCQTGKKTWWCIGGLILGELWSLFRSNGACTICELFIEYKNVIAQSSSAYEMSAISAFLFAWGMFLISSAALVYFSYWTPLYKIEIEIAHAQIDSSNSDKLYGYIRGKYDYFEKSQVKPKNSINCQITGQTSEKTDSYCDKCDFYLNCYDADTNEKIQ